MRFLRVDARELQGDLLGLLGLLSEDGLGLSTETRLLGFVATRALGRLGVLSLLVLRNLVRHMLLAVFAVGRHDLRNVHLDKENNAERVSHWIEIAERKERKQPLHLSHAKNVTHHLPLLAAFL